VAALKYALVGAMQMAFMTPHENTLLEKLIAATVALLIVMLLFLGGCRADAMEARVEGQEYGIFFTADEAQAIVDSLEELTEENKMLRELVRELDLKQIERASMSRTCL
jgi:hypothetical protein